MKRLLEDSFRAASWPARELAVAKIRTAIVLRIRIGLPTLLAVHKDGRQTANIKSA